MPKAASRVLLLSQVAVKIYGAQTSATVKAVYRLYRRNVFPGAYQLDESKPTSPIVIPEAEVDAFLAAEKKRGQTRKV